jgi:hypothetical protein
MISKLIPAAAFLAFSLTACQSAKTAEFTPLPWSDNCYNGLEKDVSYLAGKDAIDCGFLPMSADLNQRKSTLACAKNAVKSHKPFHFGYASFGDDSAYCDVAIRAADGQLYSLFFDFDVTGQLGTDGSNSALWISKCESITFRPGTIGKGSFFNQEKCVESKELRSSVVNARSD